MTGPAQTSQAQRRPLLGLACRLLGAASDAEDAFPALILLTVGTAKRPV